MKSNTDFYGRYNLTSVITWITLFQYFDEANKKNYRLLQLWPHKLYLLSDVSELAAEFSVFESMITDIRHGFCELSLGGKNVFDFIKLYLSTDLNATRISESKQLRCLLGQYQIIMWWDDIEDIRLIIDRSYAQSLRNYLVHLMQRHEWKKI